MTQEHMDFYMRFNTSAIFTFFNKGKEFIQYKELHSYLNNVYTIDETGNEDHLFFVFDRHDIVDRFIDKIDYLEKRYFDEHVLLTIYKWNWMSKKEWEHLKMSEYSSFKDTIYKNANRNKTNLQYHIINCTPEFQQVLERNYGIDKLTNNIAWKLFNFEKETLHLSKLRSMKVLGIKEDWLLNKLDNCASFEKHIYKDIIENAVEIVVPNTIGLQGLQQIKPETAKESINYKQIYENVKSALHFACGKEQYNLTIKGKKFPLMCNYVDFQNKLNKVIKKYKLTDIDRVTQCLCNHVSKLDFPMLKYYIDKDNVSELATDYNLENDGKNNDVVVKNNLSDNKELFG